ncbi:MAG: aminotransferase class IV [Chloroflexi bacterium]|nr:aminotransferase class IV [Chloroflexota bacterium]
MSVLIYLNGSLVPGEQARVSVLDYGFLYGYGLFETMRAYGGRVFRLGRHLDRLERSAVSLEIPVDTAELARAVAETVRANNLKEARIRITVSAGEGGMVPDLTTCSRPTVLVVARAYQPYPPTVYAKGYTAIFSTIRRNSQSPLPGLKSLSFLENVLARQEAKKAGANDAVFLNDRGFLAEASTSNIFLVAGGVLKTPGLSCGILPGVTREAVLELAGQMGIPCAEAEIKPEALLRADEAFLTNAIIEIMPLVAAGGTPVGSGRPGLVTRQLMAAYRRLVTAETGGQ